MWFRCGNCQGLCRSRSPTSNLFLSRLPLWAFVHRTPARPCLHWRAIFHHGWGHGRRRGCRSFLLQILFNTLSNNMQFLFTFGCQFGEYSPPAPCLDLTAMSSPISLVTKYEHAEIGMRFCGTHYCRALLSSLSLPTSSNRIRTSPARALLKSLIYLITIVY